MDVLQELAADCPYCGERITILADFSAGDQTYVEDCSVCCQPMLVSLTLAGEEGVVRLDREND